MKNRKQLLEDAYQLAEESIPTCQQHIHVAYQKGEELAEFYHANLLVVLVGLYLMDVRLVEARKIGDRSKHVSMASSFAKEFLKDYDITKEEVEQIINCIEAHHGAIPFSCIESEICANADCYRFIHPMGVFSYFGFLMSKGNTLEDALNKVKTKMQEKYMILSLESAKKELEKYYQNFLNLFETTRMEIRKEK